MGLFLQTVLTDFIITVVILSVENVKRKQYVIKTTDHVQTAAMVHFILLYAKVIVSTL